MPVVETGTPSVGDKWKVHVPEDGEVTLEHGKPYEIEWSGVVRVPELGVGGGPAFDPVAKISEELYKHVLEHGGQYPHYFYCEYTGPIPRYLNGGEYEYIIYRMRIQFIAASPFPWTPLIIIAIGILISAVILSIGIVIYIIKPAGEAAAGVGGLIIVLSVVAIFGVVAVTVGPDIAEVVMKRF